MSIVPQTTHTHTNFVDNSNFKKPGLATYMTCIIGGGTLAIVVGLEFGLILHVTTMATHYK